MSGTNADLARQALDAFNRRDREAWLTVCDPDLEDVPPRDWPESRRTRGSEAVWDLYVKNTELWEAPRFQQFELTEVGNDKTVTEVRSDVRGKASGAGVTWTYWQVATIRDGKLTRIEWFTSRAEAFEAAGLTELTMSQENERTILAMTAALNQGDWDAVLGYCTQDAKFDTTRDLNETRGFHETHEEIKSALKRFYESWESWHIAVTEFTHVDETLVVTRQAGHLRGRDGIEVVARTSSVWRFRDGRVNGLVHYREEDDARKAVGLSE